MCVAKSSRAWGDKRTRARAFPGTILARKVYLEKVRTHASSRPVAEEGANARPGKAAGKHENTGSGAALERGSATGTDAGGFTEQNKHTAGSTDAAEGDARAGGSAVAQMCMVPGLSMPRLSMKTRLNNIPCPRQIGPDRFMALFREKLLPSHGIKPTHLPHLLIQLQAQ